MKLPSIQLVIRLIWKGRRRWWNRNLTRTLTVDDAKWNHHRLAQQREKAKSFCWHLLGGKTPRQLPSIPVGCLHFQLIDSLTRRERDMSRTIKKKLVNISVQHEPFFGRGRKEIGEKRERERDWPLWKWRPCFTRTKQLDRVETKESFSFCIRSTTTVSLPFQSRRRS